MKVYRLIRYWLRNTRCARLPRVRLNERSLPVRLDLPSSYPCSFGRPVQIRFIAGKKSQKITPTPEGRFRDFLAGCHSVKQINDSTNQQINKFAHQKIRTFTTHPPSSSTVPTSPPSSSPGQRLVASPSLSAPLNHQY